MEDMESKGIASAAYRSVIIFERAGLKPFDQSYVTAALRVRWTTDVLFARHHILNTMAKSSTSLSYCGTIIGGTV